MVTPDIEEVYGNGEESATRVEQWRNFLRLNDGTIDFGKLTMHHVDLVMVDLSDDAWFDLDLEQLSEPISEWIHPHDARGRRPNLHARPGYSAKRTKGLKTSASNG